VPIDRPCRGARRAASRLGAHVPARRGRGSGVCQIQGSIQDIQSSQPSIGRSHSRSKERTTHHPRCCCSQVVVLVAVGPLFCGAISSTSRSTTLSRQRHGFTQRERNLCVSIVVGSMIHHWDCSKTEGDVNNFGIATGTRLIQVCWAMEKKIEVNAFMSKLLTIFVDGFLFFSPIATGVVAAGCRLSCMHCLLFTGSERCSPRTEV